MTSVHTQVPYDYYALKFCKPRSGVQQAQENLGEFLTGDRIENSPYQLFMEQDQFCNILCMEHVKSHDVQAFKAIIKEEYHHNWIIDNLPAASILRATAAFPLSQGLAVRGEVAPLSRAATDIHCG